MAQYKRKINPVPGTSLVPNNAAMRVRDAVASKANLPLTGNALSDARVTTDTGHLYVWSVDSATGLLTDWIDNGNFIDVDWAAIANKPTSSASNIDDAVSLKHTQGTDQGLDTGGDNAVTAAQVKSAVTNSHAPHSDDQVIPDQLSDLSDDATHRLVTDTEKSTWNAKQAALGYTPENVANKVTSFQVTPDDTHYPSEKLVKDALDGKETSLNIFNVKDYGAVGDGVTDDTDAIQDTFDAAAAASVAGINNGGSGRGATPKVYFPSAKYLISSTITMRGYVDVFAAQAMIMASETFTGVAGLYGVNSSGGWRVMIEGLQLQDFDKALYLDSGNVNIGRVIINKCGFFNNRIAIHTDCQSSIIEIDNSIFSLNVHELYNENGMVTWRGGWISRGVLTEDYDAGIINYGSLYMYDTCGVPREQTVTEHAWINNYGSVTLRNFRAGGETGQDPLVNNFAEADLDQPILPTRVILDGCWVYVDDYNPAVRLFKIPNQIEIIGCSGFAGTSVAVGWSSTLDEAAQTALIAALGTYITYSKVIISCFGNCVESNTSVPENLQFITRNHRRQWLRSSDGVNYPASHVFELTGPAGAISVGDVYGKFEWIGNDGSGSGSGVRARLRVEATGTAGGVQYVISAAPNSAAVADLLTIDSVGNIVPVNDDSASLGSIAKTWKSIYTNSLILKIATLANDATPSVANKHCVLTGGTTTITDFDDGVTGQELIILVAHSLTITHGTNIFLAGDANLSLVSGDSITLIQKADGNWYQTGQKLNFQLSTNTSLGTDDKLVPSQKAVKTYVDTQVATRVIGDGTVNAVNLLSNGDFESWLAGTSAAPDGWVAVGAEVAIAREATTIKIGTYSAKITAGAGATGYLSFTLVTAGSPSYYQGRTITFGCWVWCAAANTARLRLYDSASGTTSIYSSYHSGNSSWEYLTVTRSLSGTGNVTAFLSVVASGVAYFDGAMLVEGVSAFAFKPKPLDASKEIVVDVDETKFSHKLPIVINGTTYYIMLTAT